MLSQFVIPALLLLALIAAGAGCLGDRATDTPAPTVNADAALIAPEALASHIPSAVPGWRLLAPASAVSLVEEGSPLVSVTATYLSDVGQNGTRSADLSIQDTGGRSVGLRRLVDQVAAAPGNGTVRTTFRGQPAYVLNDGQMTGAYLVVADRYVVWLAIVGGTSADLDAFITAIDIEGLSGQR